MKQVLLLLAAVFAVCAARSSAPTPRRHRHITKNASQSLSATSLCESAWSYVTSAVTNSLSPVTAAVQSRPSNGPASAVLDDQPPAATLLERFKAIARRPPFIVGTFVAILLLAAGVVGFVFADDIYNFVTGTVDETIAVVKVIVDDVEKAGKGVLGVVDVMVEPQEEAISWITWVERGVAGGLTALAVILGLKSYTAWSQVKDPESWERDKLFSTLLKTMSAALSCIGVAALFGKVGWYFFLDASDAFVVSAVLNTLLLVSGLVVVVWLGMKAKGSVGENELRMYVCLIFHVLAVVGVSNVFCYFGLIAAAIATGFAMVVLVAVALVPLNCFGKNGGSNDDLSTRPQLLINEGENDVNVSEELSAIVKSDDE